MKGRQLRGGQTLVSVEIFENTLCAAKMGRDAHTCVVMCVFTIETRGAVDLRRKGAYDVDEDVWRRHVFFVISHVAHLLRAAVHVYRAKG
jgi:hypothetical protein